MSIRKTLAAMSAAAAVCAPVIVSSATPASAAPSDQYYVALGDSLAAGYQPTAGDDKTGGYVGGVLASLKKDNPNTKLTNLACSGEETTSMTTGSICSYPEGSQLAAAEAFLKKHQGQISLVTLDLGANDVDKCAEGSSIDMACITKGLARVSQNLPTILQGIRDAAPDARIVVANYYNPFLAFWLTGEDGHGLAKLSVQLQEQLNGSIAKAAHGVDAVVANVAATFDSTDFDSVVDTPPYGELPRNVSLICQWTWMCSRQNIHANDDGYAQMADTIIDVIPAQPPASPTTSPTSTSSPTSSTTTASAPPSSTATGTSTTVTTGPPVITDGPNSGGHDGLLWGFGLFGGAAVALTGGAAWRVKRR